MKDRRSMMLGLAALAVMPLAACSNKPLRQTGADGTYCYRVTSKSRHPTCTPDAVPSAATEAEAKRFASDPEALTLYILRSRWADSIGLKTIAVNGQAPVRTIPESLIRVRLKPGEHLLSLEDEAGTRRLSVSGSRGDIRLAEIVGSAAVWSREYQLQAGSISESMDRATSAKLIADLDLRR